MYPRISYLLLALAFVPGLASVVPAQTEIPSDCPKIEVYGPPGIVDPEGEGEFEVKLTGPVPKEVSFEWEIPDVPIVSGKQASKVRFKVVREMWGTSFTATVRVAGLPTHCTNTGSETAGIIVDPGPIHIATITNIDTQTKTFGELFDELEKNSNSQGYLFIGADLKTERHKQIEDLIRYKALGSGIDQSRLTIKKESTAKEIVELWRVPPGANNPLCRACESPADVRCPAVSVSGPSGIPKPGQPIQYVAIVKSDTPADMTYRWHVSRGTIMAGQGTERMKIGPDWAESDLSITVTVEVLGLPAGCANTASETIAF